MKLKEIIKELKMKINDLNFTIDCEKQKKLRLEHNCNKNCQKEKCKKCWCCPKKHLSMKKILK